MDDLIEALQLMNSKLKRGVSHPCHCGHFELWVYGTNKSDFTEAELKRLGELGFNWSDENDGFYSFRFGSC